MVTVFLHPAAKAELGKLPSAERSAVENAMKKLQALGEQLGYPHSSAIVGVDRLRELRPRQGRSPWRAFYRRIGEVFVIAAIGPEAAVKPRAFTKTVTAAVERLDELEATA